MQMLQQIGVEEMLQQTDNLPLIDVRSPGEFAKAHIPHAVNLPLFSDAERAEVGTLYKQVSPEEAFLRGLEYAGQKMRFYVEQAQKHAPQKKIILHCWRGGQRSSSMAWLLEKAGFQVQLLHGGYKAFRQFIHAYFSDGPYQLKVLGGPTGSGKTAILHELELLGELVLDLENLASHKGSSFGALGELPQPSVEHFENILFSRLYQLPTDRAIWVENESKGIGRIFLPDAFYLRLRQAPMVQLEMPVDWRVKNLVEEYGHFPQQALQAAFQRIHKRLGGQHVKAALEAVQSGHLAKAAEIALVYYDKTYYYGIEHKHQGAIQKVVAQERAAGQIARQLRIDR